MHSLSHTLILRVSVLILLIDNSIDRMGSISRHDLYLHTVTQTDVSLNQGLFWPKIFVRKNLTLSKSVRDFKI